MKSRASGAALFSASVLGAAMMLALLPASAPAVAPPGPAPLKELVRGVDIAFEEFTLDNGLRVIVHTDRKAPIVAVSVWYGVGSGDEPAGKTGFAHLFEHLMFNGSAGYDGEFFLPLEEVGATNANGTTNVDRTNYFQNVPTPALDLALFLEADRMGNLLPAVTQAKLDNQRGVVQNEKRLGDNQPYGLVRYAQAEGLYPPGHPYRHSTIGSMADLDAASLEDAKDWFRRFYGPNNAVLVLAGDIDAATARPMVEKRFGAIPRGPDVAEPEGGVPDRRETTRTEINDRVANPRLYFSWAIPGLRSRDSAMVDVAAAILAGGESSRLHNALVRDEQLALAVSGGASSRVISGVAQIVVDVKPGVDPAVVERRVEALIAEFLKTGPTRDETTRLSTRVVSGAIRGLEQVGGFGGKAVTLAEGALYTGDPGFFRRELAWYAEANPRTVRAAARRWLSDGDHRILVRPGERGAAELALAGVAAARPAPDAPAVNPTPDRSKLPKVSAETPLAFPAVERARLANGVEVVFARRAATPVVTVRALFDAGSASDPPERAGLQLLTLDAMREGTPSRTGRQITEEAERLGASLTTGFSSDVTQVTISALKANLGPSLALFADVVRNPTFPAAEVDRLRAIQLARIAQEEASPGGLAARTLRPMILGPDHPYGRVSSFGVADRLKTVTRDDLVAFHQRWIRPDAMRLLVVGDTTLADSVRQLEAMFGDWTPAPGIARGEKTFPAPAPTGRGRIVLIDRPNSPQSVILAGMPVGLKGTADPLALYLANEALGGAFTSRLNADLREAKGWSYGVGSGVSLARHDLTFTLNAPVQADRTADSIAAVRSNIKAYNTDKPITAEELSRAIAGVTLTLPGDFETAGAVLGAIQTNLTLGRPDDYQTTLAARYRAIGAGEVTAAARAAIDPDGLIWVVVGDAKVVEPQLARLGLPFEVRRAAPAR